MPGVGESELKTPEVITTSRDLYSRLAEALEKSEIPGLKKEDRRELEKIFNPQVTEWVARQEDSIDENTPPEERMLPHSIQPLSLYDSDGSGTVLATGAEINLFRMVTVEGLAALLKEIALPEEQAAITKTAELQVIHSPTGWPDSRIYIVGGEPILVVVSKQNIGSITTWHNPKPLAS